MVIRKTEKISDSKNKPAGRRGFSFIESMLAVAVMTTGIIAAMQLFTAGIKQSLESRDQTIGAMLAQEGAEIAQNVRDNNWAAKNTRPAFDDVYFPLADADNCRVSYASTDLMDCSDSSDSKRLFLDANYYYVHTGGTTATKFQRKIFIGYQNNAGVSVPKSSAERAEITSVVIWGDSFPAYSDVQTKCSTSSKCAFSRTVLSKWAE